MAVFRPRWPSSRQPWGRVQAKGPGRLAWSKPWFRRLVKLARSGLRCLVRSGLCLKVMSQELRIGMFGGFERFGHLRSFADHCHVHFWSAFFAIFPDVKLTLLLILNA
jgi:hypothetical protein